MGYKELYSAMDISDKRLRMRVYIEYLKKTNISGLHYVNFLQESNTVTIRRPDHSVHLLGNLFLHSVKEEYSINTIHQKAEDLKRFFDFLMVWQIDVSDVEDFLILLKGFTRYIQCTRTTVHRVINGVETFWSTLKEVPLNKAVQGVSRIGANEWGVSRIGANEWGVSERKPGADFSVHSTIRMVGNAIYYLSFLKNRLERYGAFSLNEQLPMKEKYVSGFLSSTLPTYKEMVFDVEAIVSGAGVNTNDYKPHHFSPVENDKVFTESQVQVFMSELIRSQDELLFLILKCFGLRRGEASNLLIEPSSIPCDLYDLRKTDYQSGRDMLKKNLKGDIYYDAGTNNWYCEVDSSRDETRYNARNKTGSRTIPLLFEEDKERLLDYLYYAILDRKRLMSRFSEQEREHKYLFVSLSNNSQGLRITGDTIHSKFSRVSKKLKDTKGIDISKLSPHSFRHYFATHLLSVKKFQLLIVSRLLGHRHPDTTRDIYLHYLSEQDKKTGKSVARDAVEKFSKNANTDKQED